MQRLNTSIWIGHLISIVGSHRKSVQKLGVDRVHISITYVCVCAHIHTGTYKFTTLKGIFDINRYVC